MLVCEFWGFHDSGQGLLGCDVMTTMTSVHLLCLMTDGLLCSLFSSWMLMLSRHVILLTQNACITNQHKLLLHRLYCLPIFMHSLFGA